MSNWDKLQHQLKSDMVTLHGGKGNGTFTSPCGLRRTIAPRSVRGKVSCAQNKKRFWSARRVFEPTSREICARQSETLEECLIKRSNRADVTRIAVVKGVKRG